MSNDGFLRRWSRLKSHAQSARGDTVPGAAGDDGPGRAGQRRAPAGDGTGASLQRADDVQAVELPAVAQTAPHPPFAPAQAEAAPSKLPTIEDVAALGPDSDFSAFVSQGVDKNVQHLAMKKLFSDPHFSVLDGLDVYIDDYTKASPIPAAMLATLEHSRSVFARLLEEADKPEASNDGGRAAGQQLDGREADSAGEPRQSGVDGLDGPATNPKPSAPGADDGPAAHRKPDGPQPPEQPNA
jgi:hypothetical protein